MRSSWYCRVDVCIHSNAISGSNAGLSHKKITMTETKKRGIPLWIRELQEHAKMLAPPPFDLPRTKSSPTTQHNPRFKQDTVQTLNKDQPVNRWIRPTCKQLGNGHTFKASRNFCRSMPVFTKEFVHDAENSPLQSPRKMMQLRLSPADNDRSTISARSSASDIPAKRILTPKPIRSLTGKFQPSNCDISEENSDSLSLKTQRTNSFSRLMPLSAKSEANSAAQGPTEILSEKSAFHRQNSKCSMLNVDRTVTAKSGQDCFKDSSAETLLCLTPRKTHKNKSPVVLSKAALECFRNGSRRLLESTHGSGQESGRTQYTDATTETQLDSQPASLRTYSCRSIQRASPCRYARGRNSLKSLNSTRTFNLDPPEDSDRSFPLFGENIISKKCFDKFRMEEKQLTVDSPKLSQRSQPKKSKTFRCKEKTCMTKLVPLTTLNSSQIVNRASVDKPIAVRARDTSKGVPPEGNYFSPRRSLQRHPQKQTPRNRRVVDSKGPTEYSEQDRQSMIMNAVRLFESISVSVTHSPWSKKKAMAIKKRSLAGLLADDDNISELSAYLGTDFS